jgi:hypothetical protein
VSAILDTSATPAVMRCTACGATAPFPLPLLIGQASNLLRSFAREHAGCRAVVQQ